MLQAKGMPKTYNVYKRQIFSKYMNIKASHMEKHRTKWCKYKKELVHLQSFNTDCHRRTVSS